MAFDRSEDTDTRDVPERVDRRELADLATSRRGDRLGDRMLGGGLDRAGEAQDLGSARTVEGHLGELHAALGDRARLVEHDRPDPPRPLEDLGASYHDAG